MSREKQNPDYNHMLLTELAPDVKAMITKYRKAVEEHAFIGSKDPEDHEGITESLQIARYNLERTILTHITKSLHQ